MKFEPEAFGAFVRRVDEGSLSSAGGKAVLEELVDRGGDVDAIIESAGLAQVSDASALEAVVDRVLAENPGPVAQFLGGKEGALNALIGPVMRETRGCGQPPGGRRAAAKAPDASFVIAKPRDNGRMYVIINHVA